MLGVLRSLNAERTFGLVALLWFAAAAAAGGQLLLQLLLAREMQPSDYGSVAATLAICSTASSFASFGVPTFWLRIFGEKGWDGTRWLPASFRLVCLSASVIVACLLLWAVVSDMSPVRRLLLAFLSTYVFGQVAFELVGSKLQLEERYGALASWQLVPPASRLALVVLLSLSALLSPVTVAACFAITAALMAFIGIRQMMVMTSASFALKGHEFARESELSPLPNTLAVASGSWVYGLDAAFFLVYLQSGVVVLQSLRDSSSAGIFNAAFVMMMAVYLFPSVVYQKFLAAKMHRWADSDREKLVRNFRLGNFTMLALGLVAMLALWVVGPWLINLLFGARYAAAAGVLHVLAVCAPLRFLSSNVSSLIATANRLQRAKVLVMGLAAGLNIAAGVLLVTRAGAIGAAWAAVIAEAAVLVGFWIVIRKGGCLRA
jgi:O-antigen/teichoic acid export membrane protein